MAVSGLTCGNFMRQLWRIYGSNDSISSRLRHRCRENRGALARPTRIHVCQLQPTTNSDKLSDSLNAAGWLGALCGMTVHGVPTKRRQPGVDALQRCPAPATAPSGTPAVALLRRETVGIGAGGVGHIHPARLDGEVERHLDVSWHRKGRAVHGNGRDAKLRDHLPS